MDWATRYSLVRQSGLPMFLLVALALECAWRNTLFFNALAFVQWVILWGIHPPAEGKLQKFILAIVFHVLMSLISAHFRGTVLGLLSVVAFPLLSSIVAGSTPDLGSLWFASFLELVIQEKLFGLVQFSGADVLAPHATLLHARNAAWLVLATFVGLFHEDDASLLLWGCQRVRLVTFIMSMNPGFIELFMAATLVAFQPSVRRSLHLLVECVLAGHVCRNPLRRHPDEAHINLCTEHVVTGFCCFFIFEIQQQERMDTFLTFSPAPSILLIVTAVGTVIARLALTRNFQLRRSRAERYLIMLVWMMGLDSIYRLKTIFTAPGEVLYTMFSNIVAGMQKTQ